MESPLPVAFSWRDNGVAVQSVDQHEQGWCGACYLVATAQVAVDRYRKKHLETHGRLPLHVLDLQSLLNDFDVYQRGKEVASWTACKGGHSEDVSACLLEGHCRPKMVPPAARRWLGYVTFGQTSRKKPAFTVQGYYRVQPRDVKREIFDRGTVGLDINADVLLAAVDGVVDAQSALQSSNEPENHCVTVVGWTEACWVVRNSWGDRLPEPRDCARYGCAAAPAASIRTTRFSHKEGYCLLPFVYAPLGYTGEATPWFALELQQP